MVTSQVKRKSRKKQLEFQGKEFRKLSDSFGGSQLKGNPRGKRPLDSKLPIHLTLRARKSVLLIPKMAHHVTQVIESVSRKHGVKVYKFANVGNHIHLAIKIAHVRRWAAFIRELTGHLALKFKKVAPEGSFWLFRPHTRIIRGWQKAFKTLKEYIYLNQLEANGFISRKEIKNLKDLRAIFDG